MSSTEVISPQKGPQTLFRTGALGPGSNLWVICNGEASEWSKKLDWYLNFQISKASDHSPKELAEEFSQRLQEYEMTPLMFNQKSDLLMISCEGRLPTKMLIIVPFQNDFEEWLKNIHKVWLNLLKPQLRIFLPNEFPINDFSQLWPDRGSITEITLVPSQKSSQV